MCNGGQNETYSMSSNLRNHINILIGALLRSNSVFQLVVELVDISMSHLILMINNVINCIPDSSQ